MLIRLRRRAAQVASILVAAAFIAVPALGAAGLWRSTHDRLAGTVLVPSRSLLDQAAFVEDSAGAVVTAVVDFRRLPGTVGEWSRTRSLADAVEALSAATSEAACVVAVRANATLIDRELAEPAHLGAAQKVLVGAVALEVLGPEYRFGTEIRGGEIVDGIHRGDLVIVGGGDPLLFSDAAIELARLDGIEPTDVGLLVDQLEAAGLRGVEGDLIGDGRRFDNEFVLLDPEQPGSRPPQIAGLLINRGLLVGASYGLNPVQTAANEINRLLAARGIAVTGRSRSTIVEMPEMTNVLARVESVPLDQLVTNMIAMDDDVAADMLLKAIGAEMTGLGSRAAGLAVVQTTLSNWNDSTPRAGDAGPSRRLGVIADLADGAGRDSRNRMSCAALALAAARWSPGGEATSFGFDVPGRDDRLEILFATAEGAQDPLVAVVLGSLSDPVELIDQMSIGAIDHRLLVPLDADLR